jgi:hypothetical protein
MVFLNFMTVVVDTFGLICDDFSRNEIQEESGQFRFLRASYLVNIKGSVGLLLDPSLVL